MSGTVLITASLALLGSGIGLLVVTLVPARKRKAAAVPGAVAAIERGYTRQSTLARSRADTGTALPGWLADLALRLSPAGTPAAMQRRLDLAGNPPTWSVERVLAVKGLGLFTFAAVAALFGLRNPALLVVLAIAGAAFGFFLPDLLLYNTRLKRQQKIRVTLPDALDMLTVCVEAGLGFDSALAQVARNTKGPLAAEFARALQEVQIGKARSQALRGMIERTTVPELRMFVSALIQSGELGISISQVLREQAREMRLRRRQRAEEMAQQVSVKILFPLVCCLFPALFVIVIGPGAINIAHTLLHL